MNSAYFYNHGGYEFAKQFYADAYTAGDRGREQYILRCDAADERNQAMSEALGEIKPLPSSCGLYPCGGKADPLVSGKDEVLSGEPWKTITQVSRSNNDCKPVLTKTVIP